MHPFRALNKWATENPEEVLPLVVSGSVFVFIAGVSIWAFRSAGAEAKAFANMIAEQAANGFTVLVLENGSVIRIPTDTPMQFLDTMV